MWRLPSGRHKRAPGLCVKAVSERLSESYLHASAVGLPESRTGPRIAAMSGAPDMNSAVPAFRRAILRFLALSQVTPVDASFSRSKQISMNEILEPRHPTFRLIAIVSAAIRAAARGLAMLAGEHSLAKVAAAKAELFRQRRAELRALYVAPQCETGVDSEARGPVGDPAAKVGCQPDVIRVNAERTP